MTSKTIETEVLPSTRPRGAAFELILMRHGEAVDPSDAADDARRTLTPTGKKKVREIAQGLGRLGVELDCIVTSPLVRAVETAEIVGETFAPPVKVEFSDVLTPGATATQLAHFLSRDGSRRSVLAVGHEPDLTAMAAQFIGAGPKVNFAFKKGGCCLIAFDESLGRLPGRLVWWLPPRVLRRVK